MIIVLGSVVVDRSRVPEALALSQAHVDRSRLESGCLEHAVHVDAEQSSRLVFVEQWQDLASLQAHFALDTSKSFVRELSTMAVEPPSMTLYDAKKLPLAP